MAHSCPHGSMAPGHAAEGLPVHQNFYPVSPVMSCSSEFVIQKGALFLPMPLKIVTLLCLCPDSKGKNPSVASLVPYMLGNSKISIKFNYVNTQTVLTFSSLLVLPGFYTPSSASSVQRKHVLWGRA